MESVVLGQEYDFAKRSWERIPAFKCIFTNIVYCIKFIIIQKYLELAIKYLYHKVFLNNKSITFLEYLIISATI